MSVVFAVCVFRFGCRQPNCGSTIIIPKEDAGEAAASPLLAALVA